MMEEATFRALVTELSETVVGFLGVYTRWLKREGLLGTSYTVGELLRWFMASGVSDRVEEEDD